jgi:hypothetical protein
MDTNSPPWKAALPFRVMVRQTGQPCNGCLLDWVRGVGLFAIRDCAAGAISLDRKKLRV